MRETSVKCYRKIVESGVLSKIRRKVYDGLSVHGPATAGELSLNLPMGNGIGHMSANNVATVLTQLRDKLGVVYELGTRPCRITGHECIEWELKEDAWPIVARHVVPKKTARQRIAELELEVKTLATKCERLERENVQLKKPVQQALF